MPFQCSQNTNVGLQSMSYFATTKHGKERLEKDRLPYFASPAFYQYKLK
jgi:hypothetical protein